MAKQTCQISELDKRALRKINNFIYGCLAGLVEIIICGIGVFGMISGIQTEDYISSTAPLGYHICFVMIEILGSVAIIILGGWLGIQIWTKNEIQ